MVTVNEQILFFDGIWCHVGSTDAKPTGYACQHYLVLVPHTPV